MTETLALPTIARNLARSAPYTIYLSGILATIVTGNPVGILFTLAAILFGDVLNFFLKKGFQLIGPNRSEWMRPKIPAEGCGIYPECNPTNPNTWGMPSGHAQIIAFSAVFWILYMWRRGNWFWALIGTLLIVLLASLLIYSRVLEGCHNIQQVLVGAGIGGVLGLIAYFIVD